MQWRRQQRLLRTLQRRPELLATAQLDTHDLRFLAQHGYTPRPRNVK
jgi:tRNA (guanine37-N1)-methyltransferase